MSKLKSSTSTILWINQCNHHWVQHVSRTVVAVWGELLTNMFIHYRRRLYLWPHHIPSLLVNYPEREPGPRTTTAHIASGVRMGFGVTHKLVRFDCLCFPPSNVTLWCVVLVLLGSGCCVVEKQNNIESSSNLMRKIRGRTRNIKYQI